MMLLAATRRSCGAFTVTSPEGVWAWLATWTMAAARVAMLCDPLRGVIQCVQSSCLRTLGSPDERFAIAALLA